MDAEFLKIIGTGVVAIVAGLAGALLNSKLARTAATENRTALASSEAASWERAQKASHDSWLREERTKVHFQFLEKLAEMTAVAAGNPTPGSVTEWEPDFFNSTTEVNSHAARMLDRMKLLCEFPTYIAACYLYFEHGIKAALVADGPRRVMTDAAEQAEFERLTERIVRLEKIYMDAVRAELSVALEDSRATIFD